MSQPQPFSRAFSFTNFQAANPTTSLPGSQVDLELNNAKKTLDGVLANLGLLQNDDGSLANGSVGLDQLAAEVSVGFNAPTVWTTATAFVAGASTVFQGSGFYRCLISHTSGVFATDLAAGDWQLIVNMAAVPLVNASQIAVTPSGSLTSNVQTSLQALDTGKAPLSHTQTASTISDSTAAGRALLTAANAAAQNTLLGTTALGFQSGDIKETAVLVLQSGWYYCDGSNKNRVTDAPLFNAITIQQNGTTTGGSAVITGLSDTTNGGNTPMSPGMPLSGTGIPAGARILSVDSTTQITMSANATAGSTTPLVFAPFGVGDGSTTFGLPNGAYIGVGRDNASGSASNITQFSTTITTTNGSTTATVAAIAGLAVGMFISHPKFPNGTTIQSVNPSGGGAGTVTLSNPATALVSTSAVRFSPLLDAQTIGATGGALSHATTLGELPTGITSNGTNGASINAGAYTTAPVGYSSFSANAGSQVWSATSAGNFVSILNPAWSGNIAVTSNNTGGNPLSLAMPMVVKNYIIKR